MNIKFKLLKHQKEFIKSIHPMTLLLCGRASGKTYCASLLASLELIKGKKVIVYAQTYKALAENLMSEIIKRLQEMHIPFNYNKSSQKITYNNGIIYGLSYESPDACRGFTEISTVLLDEVALAPPDILSVLSFCLRGADIEPRIYMMTTPRMGSWFNRFINENNDINIIRSNIFENKFITEKQIDLMKKACVDEELLRQELYGEIVESSSNGHIFTTDILNKQGTKLSSGCYCIGMDNSGLGRDMNTIIVRDEFRILEIIERQFLSEQECFQIINGILLKYGKDKCSHIAIDAAFGLSHHNRLKEYGIYSELVSFGGSAIDVNYQNMRTQIYFNLYEYLKDNGLSGLTDKIKQELQATAYILNNNNKLALIPKDEIKMIIGRSPDTSDALALSFIRPIINKVAIKIKREQQTRFLS